MGGTSSRAGDGGGGAGFRREWEKLEAKHLRLSDWEHQRGNRIQVVSSRAAEERAKFE
jgi:hypothetical protein